MPKLKTHKGASKRFRLTAGGKLMRRHASRSHLLEHKSPKRKREMRKMHGASHGDAKRILRIAPYL